MLTPTLTSFVVGLSDISGMEMMFTEALCEVILCTRAAKMLPPILTSFVLDVLNSNGY